MGKIYRLLLIVLLAIKPFLSFSEGTKQIQPTSSDDGRLMLDAGWSNFAQVGCAVNERLQIRVCNPNEKIYFGFNQLSGNTTKFQIKDPSGNIVMGPTTIPTSGTGWIKNYTQAVTGPSAITTGGYSAYSYSAGAVTGDYYIEFSINGGGQVEFNYFDITVASSANVAIPGRVWSKSWLFTTGSFSNPFKGKAYIYANDSIVTSIDFNGMLPYEFVLQANDTGPFATGNFVTDRQSVTGKPSSASAKYKIFLNDPDNVCYPSGRFGELTQPATVTGCPPTNFCINVSVDRPGSAQVLLDLNGTTGYQAGTKDRLLSQILTAPGGCIPWDGKDGLGNTVTTAITITTKVQFFNGLTNLPLYDVEQNPNGYKVSLVRPTGPITKLYWDDTNISGGGSNLPGCTASACHTWGSSVGNVNTINTWWYADSSSSVTSLHVPPSIIVNADTRPTGGAGGKKDTTICGSLTSYSLNASVAVATGGQWTTTGTGTFSPSNTSLNGTYNATAADIAAGSVSLILTSTGNGACPAVKDTLTLRFQKVPSSNAGAAATVCANNAAVSLTGTVTNATGGTWTTNGSGSFASPSSLNTTYTPSAADTTAGSVTLTLSTTGNNKCAAGTSTKVVTIQASPKPNAGPAQSLCNTTPTVTLAGTVTGATSQSWSGGAGTYNPNNTTLNAVYTPTAAEKSSGTVNLILTGNRAGCNAVQSKVTITFTPNPTATAGSNQSICRNNPAVSLSGAVTNATSFSWSAGGGTFSPNNTTLATTYTPTAAELAAASYNITLTANKAGCTSATSTLTVTNTASPIVNAGSDGTVCANKPAYTLAGSSSTGSATWTGSGGTFFPNANTLNAVYTPSAGEISSQLAMLILTSGNNNNCNAVKDTMLIVISKAPTANAGLDRSACSNNPAVVLAGTITNSSGGVWSGGSGTFSPNNTTLGATYTPSAAEISAGSVNLTLTASKATCNPVTDDMVITFTPSPTINAGANQSVCYNNAAVNLNGSVTVATGGTWTGGAGTFNPNANTLNATYTPTTTEKNNGSVTLTLTSTNNGTCNAVTSNMTISVTPAPTANPGVAQSSCANNPNVTLNGSVTVATGGTWSGGAGTFIPNVNTLNATYTPTAAEISTGSATLTLTTANNGNCNAVSNNVTITYTAAPTVNAGANQTICADNPTATLNGSKTVATGGIWSGGAGSFNPNNTTLNATYTATAGEISAGTVTLTLTTTGNTSNCNAVSAPVTLTIKPAPGVNAGTDQTICSSAGSVALNGTITNAPSAIWTTNGTGTFSPNATTLNASYNPSAADKSSGSVTLTLTTTGMTPCIAVNDQMVITFTGVPSINAGPAQIVCPNAFPVQLNGSGSPAKWSGGSGTFSNVNILNPTYTPSSAEVTAGTTTLTLTTNPSGACPTVSSQVTITIPPAPVANSGGNQTMCGNSASISLNGTVTNALGGFWTTSGTGSFSNPSILNPTYTPSALDKTNGSVTLTLSTTGNGNCPGTSNLMVLTIQPAIVVTAGPNQTVCADNNGFALSGASVTNATGGSWTTAGSGTFNPNANTIAATYIPSAADKTAGTVTLTLTSTGNGVCPAQTSSVTYTITPAPTVNAGLDQTICADVNTITLNGSYTIATGIQWATTGTGTFTPNTTTTNAVYTPSAADKTGGTVIFTLTTTGNGNCNPVVDNMMLLTITPKPVVNAGPDKTVCGDAGAVSITGTVSNAAGGAWTTNGDGTFANSNALSTTYTLGPNDIANGIVTLTLTSTGNGTCMPVSDQMVFTITPIPTVNAGADRNICKNNPGVNLLGTVTVAGGGIWSGGAGSFSPNNTSLSTTYTPTAAELTAGSLTLTLTTTNNGLCTAKADQMVITFTNSPTINAGLDQTICADSMGIGLNGTFTVATGGLWSSSGTGSFVPNNATANATYIPSAADRNSGSATLTFTSSGNGNCNAVNDQMVVTITTAPTVNAGPDQTVCGNNSGVTLSGTKTIASGAKWTTSGTGTFGNATSLNTTYTPSALDITTGSVIITLTTSGNGSCKAVSDQMTINISPAPTVNAGPDQSVCANNPAVSLNGSFTIAGGAVWSGGTGSFTPSANAVNATYNPSTAEITAGIATLTLTTTSNGLCNAVNDQIVIHITNAPTVNAGTDQTVCADVAGVNLTGTVTVAGGGTWTSTGSGTFTPNASTLNAVYKPSNADTLAKTVTLTLTTTGNGTCTAVNDQMVITIKPVPIVNAGPDQTACGDADFIDLAGSVTNATGGTWTTSGSGIFSPGATALNGQYVPSGAETNGGVITLTLTSTGMGTCNPVTDQVQITLKPIPSTNAGPDQTVCSNNATVTLNGSVTNATGGTWLSNGDGTFSNPNSLNANYTPSVDDIASGSIAITLVSTGNGVCRASSDKMIVTFTPAPTANAGADQSVCANNPNVTLAGTVTVATGGTWTSTGTGNFTPSSNSLNAVYHPSAADIAAGTFTLTLATTGNNSCLAVQDQMIVTVTPAPTSTPGANQTVCANNATITLNGAVTVASGGTWTSSGTGTFANANALSTTYTPSAADKTAGSVVLTLTTTGNNNCNAVSNTMTVTFTPAPTVNAGANQSICANNAIANLNGTVTVATGGTWTTAGSGTFGNANNLITTYTASAADITAGSVTLTLTSTGNGTCSPVTSTTTITITNAPTANAGANQSVCANNPNVTLNGTVSVAGGGSWTTSGSGTFTPSVNTLNAVYHPSAADITAGNVTLTLTTTGNNNCNAVTSNTTITITPAPTSTPGANQTVCANNATVTLNGSVTVASGGTWTSSGTGSFANANALSTTYTPSAADKTAGSVVLTLTTTGNNNCNAVSNTMSVTITPAPIVNAGASQSICANNATANLNGIITVATGGTWTTSGSGTFGNANNLVTTYTASAADITAGSVTLTLSSTGNGTCSPVTSTTTITITPAPTANAGTDQSVCANNANVTLNGAVTVASGGTWTTSGSGTFAPSINNLNASYTPSAADIASGIVTLTLSTTGNNNCNAVQDQVNIIITPAPTVTPGANQTVCANNAVVTLNGTITVAGGGHWTSSGTGTFGNANLLSTTYTPSAADITGGNVTLTLTSTTNINCNAVNNQMTVTITPAPTVNAGANQTVCANNAVVNLNGTVTVATGGTWSTSGSGTFANANALATTYTPSAADITAGNITLTLTSTGNGTCTPVTSTATVTITPAPTSNAGANQSVCANNDVVTLNGVVTVATGGTWTSTGSGTFAPSANTLNATYTPSAADVTTGNVTLTLTTTGNGTCTPVTSNTAITITPAPTVNPGANQTVCANNNVVTLNGVITVASGGTWTSSGTGSFANANALSTTYTPSAADVTAGNVTLTLTTTGNNNCNAVNKSMTVTITPSPTVIAGANQTVCANNSVVNLNGTITVATGATWTTSGSGAFGNANNLSTTYTPSAADITAGNVTLTLTTTGNGTCTPVTSTTTITFTPAPTANAGANQSVCANNDVVTLNGVVTVATGGSWTSTGSGTFAPSSNTLNATYTPSAADVTAGNVILTLTTTGIGTCTPVTSNTTITITPAPTVNPGANQTVCANNDVVTLNGVITVATGGTWTSSGTGSFANANALSTTYTPSASDVTAGNVTLTLTTIGNNNCTAVSKTMTVTITPAPTVNAGANQTVCANNSVVNLNGTITVATGATWTTAGSGAFGNANNLSTTYTPSAADITAGNVTLTLTTTGNGTCTPVTSTTTITITPAPTANAGVNQTVCANNRNVALSGVITVATGATWTSTGTGTFTPNANDLNATYRPSAAEVALGTSTLTLTTTGNGTCTPVTSNMTITITPSPTSTPGANQTVCANNDIVPLNGAVTVASGGTWTSSGTGIFANANALSTTYTPSAADVTAGNVTLTLTTTGNGTCNAVSKTMTVTITPAPTVNAGANQTVCANNSVVNLNGTVTVATGGTWTTAGSGAFGNANNLSTTYTPSAADITAGNVTLTLTTTGNGTCTPVTSNMTITITPAPTASAGANQSVCANNNAVTLNGSITVAPGATWTTTGSGTFSPSVNALNATYTPSAADNTAGNVTLTLTTTGNNNCNAATSSMVVTITPAPTVNPGAAFSICADATNVPLNGIVTVATGGTWSTASGTGTFTPNANTLNATFTPSASQIANGRANLTLTTTGNGNCAAVSAPLIITITPVPTVNAGADVTVCAGTANIPLNGTITNSTGATWTTTGTGAFVPNANTLNATYQPSGAENVAGTVITMTLTTTGNGSCAAAIDQMTITLNNLPVDAGPDQTVCSNMLPVQLNGVGSGTWSGGAGTFSDPTALNATYTPTAGEIPGTVTLTLSTAVGSCTGSDNVNITFIDGPKSIAGANQSVCSNNAVVTMAGSVQHAGGGIWKTEGTGTFDDNTLLNAIYTASPAEIASGSVKLTLVTTSNGTCNADSSTMLVTFTPTPVVNAGTDQASCANSGAINLSGSVNFAPGATWSKVTGTGAIGAAGSLNTTYTPTAADAAAGSVTLRLTSDPISNCTSVFDDIIITFGAAPTANAGGPQNICKNNPVATLNGSVTIASGGTWTSNGTGTFSPNADDLHATYTASANDLTTGNVTLTLKTTGNGNCAVVQDQMIITYTATPTANAGGPQSVCANNASVTLNGTVTQATGGTWATSGTGSFAPNALSSTYTPSASDIAAGSVTLTLSTTGMGNCLAVTDQAVITFDPTPIVDAGLDQASCANAGPINLNGSVTNAPGATWSKVTGTGVIAVPASLSTTYTPTAADATAGSVTLRLTSNAISNCTAVSDDIIITFGSAPTANAGGPQNICKNNPVATLNGSVTVASGGTWTSNGTGSFSPNADALNATYTASANDLTTGNVTLTLTTTGNGNCTSVQDQMIITYTATPTVNAGGPQSVCANNASVTLNGTVTQATGGTWATSGTGSFAPNALSSTYTPSASDIAAGSVTLTLSTTGMGNCLAVTDQAVITFDPTPVVNAGLDQASCANAGPITLNGTATNTPGATWSIVSGTGSIAAAGSLNTTYTPTAADATAGSVTLRLTSNAISNCTAVSDDITITFGSAPTVIAGGPQNICSNNPIATLNGSVTIASGGNWTSNGTGTFSPNANTLNATYTASANDVSNGIVTLTLTTTGNGNCTAVLDQMVITFTATPTAVAGAPQSLCSNNPNVTLNGTVTQATGGTWATSGTGSFAPNALSSTYTPSAADIAGGSVTLTLTTTGMGNCLAVSDQTVITFTPTPTVDAGLDLASCANAGPVSLNGNVTTAPSATWSIVSGTGSIANANALSTTYTPSAADVTAGSITLRLTSDPVSNCNSVSDDVTITFGSAPTVSAGGPQNICSNNPVATLNGSVTIASGGTWTTAGTGTFSPSANALNATYTASANDVSNGNVTLTLTTTGNGNCTAVLDQMTITFTPTPTAVAGAPQTLCSNNPNVTLNGTVTQATGGTWATSGTGSFAPNALSSTYTPSASDLAAGSVTLTLTTTGFGNCLAVSDQTVITFSPTPVVSAGADQASCANAGPVTLNGSVNNAPSATWSIVSGTGTLAAPGTLNTTYTPSAADVTAGSITLRLTSDPISNCNAVSDDVTITFGSAPTVSAGGPQNICSNNPVATLNGSVTIASGGTWTTAGTGTFSPNADVLNATYTASANDVSNGNVTLTLTTTGNGNCTAVLDQMTITFTPTPTAVAGAPQTLCSNNPNVTLNGTVTQATGGTWATSGTGTFAPNALSSTYTPSAADIAGGTVTLTLTTTGMGNCLAVSDQTVITFSPTPTVDAGMDLASCANAGPVTLNGAVTTAPTATWSIVSGTGAIANANALSTTYTPSAADVTAGSITLRLTSDPVSNCNSISDDVTITFGSAPTVSAGGPQNICSNNPVATLNGSVTIASGGTWATAGTGTFSPNADALNATYTASANDVSNGNVTLTLTTTGNGNCTAVQDQMTITFTPTPTAVAGAPQTLCSNNPNVTLNGTVTQATGGTWTSSGTGTFAPDANTLNASYNPSAADVTGGTVTLTLSTTGMGNCLAVSDQMVVTFSTTPTVDAGMDLASCANAGPVNLNGAVTVAPSATWSIVSGTGAIANVNALSTTYTPTAADVTAGSVTLRLTSDPISNCNAVSDDVIISLGSAPTVAAGSDQTACADVVSIDLSGSVTIATGGQWSTSGSGIFTPDAFTLNASYVPSAADTAAHTVTLTLTTTGNGNCFAVSDPMDITLTPAPTVEAGPDQIACSDIATINISGLVTTATGGKWTSAGTGAFGNNTSLNTTYTPSAAERAAGSVILTLSTTGNGTCNQYTDYMSVILTPSPTIYAGPDQAVCVDVNTVTLEGSATVATSGTWTTNGSGTFTSPNTLITDYTPSAADKTAGSVTLTVTSTNMGTCNAVTDQMILSFTGAPTISAGNPRNICSDIDTLQLAGKFTVASGVIWSTSGDGTFSPDPTDPNAIYYLSANDKNQTSITLTLTSTGNGSCNTVSDQILINIAPKPVVTAGTDLTICAGQANALLNGTVTNATGGVWTTNGQGTFSNANALNTSYIPSPNDFINGGVVVTLTSTGNGLCNAVSDVLAVNILPAPAAVVNAGMDQIVCSDVSTVQLNGFIRNAGGGIWSTTSTGTFSPDKVTLNATYAPTAADKTAGSVQMILTTTNNGLCAAVTDTMNVTFTPAPTVAATAPLSVCGDLAGSINLNGNVTVATGGIWTTGGTGVFAVDNVTMTPTYYPSPDDKAAGRVGLTLTTTGNGTCQPVTKTVNVNITRPPTINAGPDQTVCANNPVIAINASVTVATGGIWTSSPGTGTFGNNTFLSTTYAPSSADTTAKSINLIVTSTGNGTCTAVSDKMKITFVSVPVVNAGADRTVCADGNPVQLTGLSLNATGGLWTTTGSGTFSNPNSLTTTYTPSNNDNIAGSVSITLTSVGSTVCSPISDPMVVTLQAKPTANPGTATICEVNKGAALNGIINSASGGAWSTSGSGVFAPSIANLNAVYYPSAADVTAGSVKLTLTSTGNGACAAASGTTNLSIDPMPIANAGQDQFVCPNSTVTLVAQTSKGVTYDWSDISGAPLASSPNITFTATSNDDYVLTVTNAKGCFSMDTVNVDIFTLPVLTLNPNSCLSNSLILNANPTPQPNVPGIYNWYKNGNILNGEHAPVYSPYEKGTYLIKFAYGDCFVSASTIVSDPPKLVGNFIKDCENRNIPITVKANKTGLNYAWNTVPAKAGVDLSTINITVVQDTTYYVATVTDGVGCSSKDSVRVIGIPKPNLALQNISSCIGRSEILHGRPTNIVNLDSLYPTYNWYKNGTSLNLHDSTLTIKTDGAYKEELTIGQCTVDSTINIVFHVNPVVTLPDYAKFCKELDNKAIINAGDDNGVRPKDTYLWTAPAGITLDSNNTQSITVRNEGYYKVVVTNSFNCPTTDSIFVDELCPPRVFVPTAFLPDKPGPDQVFKVFGDYYHNYRMIIFNRWGEVIFNSTDPNEGWDGKYRGETMPIGVYPWIITYEGDDPANRGPYRKEGSVTIVR